MFSCDHFSLPLKGQQVSFQRFKALKNQVGAIEEVDVGQELSLCSWEIETPDSVAPEEMPHASLKDRPLCLLHIPPV